MYVRTILLRCHTREIIYMLTDISCLLFFLLSSLPLTCAEVLSQDQCRLGWVYRNGYCFGLAREWLSWSEAEVGY